MALPTFVNKGATAASAGAISPTMPASIQADDILLLFLQTANEAITVSGGTETWTEVTDSPQGTGTGAASGSTRLTAFWARATSSSATSPTTSDSGDHQIGFIAAFRGCITTGNPWNVTSGNTDTNFDSSGVIGGDTTTVADCLVVMAIAVAFPDATTTTVFSSWANADLDNVTERQDNSTNAGVGGGLGTATGEKPVAGAYGNTTVTLSDNSVKGFMTIALQPPATTAVKTVDGLAKASVKTVNGLAIASVKTIDGLA